MRLTPERKRIFLDAVRQTGSLRAAAALASPHSDPSTYRPGYETFRDAARRDPAFAQEIREALNDAMGAAEKLLAERMLTPDTRPIFDKNGNLLGVQTDHRNANQLLLAFLARHDPNSWAPKKHLGGEIAHQHDHRHEFGPGRLSIHPSDILALPEEDRAAFMRYVEVIEQARAQRLGQSEQKEIEDVPDQLRLPPGSDS